MLPEHALLLTVAGLGVHFTRIVTTEKMGWIRQWLLEVEAFQLDRGIIVGMYQLTGLPSQ
jgi:hypothetical protein